MIEINNIYLGECIEKMAEIPSQFVDLTITSPPYDNLRSYNKSLVWNQNTWESIIKELYRVTKDGGVVRWHRKRW